MCTLLEEATSCLPSTTLPYNLYYKYKTLQNSESSVLLIIIVLDMQISIVLLDVHTPTMKGVFAHHHLSDDAFYAFMYSSKGRHPNKKVAYFRALPKLAKPPPHPPIRAAWSSFFRTSKRRFTRMTGKSTNDDNDNCHDNYDSNDGNFDDYDEKMTKKIQIL